MNYTISLKNYSNIIWFVIVIYFVEQFILQPQSFFLLELGAIVLLMISSRRIVMPRVAGLRPYLAYIIFISIVGLAKYGLSLVQRDLFYQLGSLVTIALGYYLYILYDDKGKSLWSTICLMLLISSIICLSQGLFEITSDIDFSDLRNIFGLGIKATSILLPLLAGKRLFLKEKSLPWQLDYVAIILWTVQIVLNMSRTAIVNIAISSAVFVIVMIVKKGFSGVALIKIIIFVIVMIAAVTTIQKILPNEATDKFGNKMDKMFTEVGVSNNYNSMATAQADWRGYENSQAIKQWKKENTITQIFGAGNGRIIGIYFVPEHWRDTIERQGNISGVTILHNTYYTLLIKGGIVLVALLFLFIIMNFRVAIKLTKKDKYLFEGIVLLSLVFYIVVDGYVIRTMIERGEEIAPMLLLGYYNALYYRTRDIEGETDEEV